MSRENESAFAMRESIREGREVKKEAAENEIRLAGARGRRFEAIQDNAHAVLDEVRRDYGGWIDAQREKFTDYLEDISPAEVDEAFREGLDIFLKMHVRLYRKTDPEREVELSDMRRLKEIVQAFAFDFIRVLQTAKDLDMGPRTGLEVARLAYRHNPDDLLEVARDYPEFEIGVIAHALTKTPLQTKEFLDQVRGRIPELNEKFPEFSEASITKAAVNYPKDPDGLLSRVRQGVAELSAEFPDMEPSTLRGIVMSRPKEAPQLLRDLRTILPDLQRDYPDFGRDIVQQTALDSPRTVRARLDRMREQLPGLARDYSEFDRSLLLRAVSSYRDPERYLAGVRTSVEALRQHFPEFELSEIQLVAIHHPNGAEQMLSQVREQLPSLKERYPDFLEADLVRVQLSYAKPEEFFDAAMKKLPDLQTTFPEVKPSALLHAAVHSPNDPEGYYRKFNVYKK